MAFQGDALSALRQALTKGDTVDPALGVQIVGTISSGGTTTGTLTNRSGTIAAGGTAQNAIAANTSRKYLLVHNPLSATEALWVSVVGTAAAASPSIQLDAGDFYITEGTFVPSNAVSVFAATTAHAFTVWEG